MTEPGSTPLDLTGLKWNEWRSSCGGWGCQLTPHLKLDVFITLKFANPLDAFNLVPQTKADEVFDKAAKLIAWTVENERAVFAKAAEKDIPKLANRSRSKKKPKSSPLIPSDLNPAWKALFIRDEAECPIELQYEFDLATMTALNGHELVIFVGSDLQYRKTKLRGGFNPLD